MKIFPSVLAKMVPSFIKLDTIPRLFLKILKKKIDEFTNKLSFVTPEKSKREEMSEVQVFFTEVNDQYMILEVSTQDSQVKYIFLALYHLSTRYYFYFQFKLSF